MSILYSKVGGVATITLNRPEKYNSGNKEMTHRLQESLDDCAQDEAVRVVVITGAGKAFCAGQDLGEVVDPHGPELDAIVREHYNPIIRKIRSLRKPVIAAVNGVAAGAGANIALSCDIVVAKASASFIQAFSKIGLIPDSGGTFFLPRLVGFGKASALMMLGDKVSATEAERLGMIYKVVDDDTFEGEISKLAHKVAAMPTKGLGYTKELLNMSYEQTIDQQLDAEEKYQTLSANTTDYKEGVDAFLQKRKPAFIGK